MDANGDEISCPNGGKNYFEIFQQRYGSAAPDVSVLIQRQHNVFLIPAVPIVLFDLGMLLETFLPSFVLGVGFLALGAVVLRADPTVDTNLVFSLFTTIVAAFAFNQGYSFIITPRWGSTALAAVLMVIIWMPLLGAVTFHMVDLLIPDGPLAGLNRVLRKPYYLLSALVAAIGVVAFVLKDHPLVNPVGTWYLAFIAASLAFAVI